jgi:hypothetical protein
MTMHDALIEAKYEPLDAGLREILEQTTESFTSILNELMTMTLSNRIR